MARSRNFVDVQEPIPGFFPGKLCRVHIPVPGKTGWVPCARCPAKIRVGKAASMPRRQRVAA